MTKAFSLIWLDFTRWVYRQLIVLYPRPYRDRFEGEMLQLFDTQLRHPMVGEPKNLSLTLWMDWIPDLFTCVIRERIIDLEGKMRNSRSVLNALAGVILLAWITFVGLTEARYFFHLAIQDPTTWLLGSSFTSLAYASLTAFILLAPFVALVLSARPFFMVHF